MVSSSNLKTSDLVEEIPVRGADLVRIEATLLTKYWDFRLRRSLAKSHRLLDNLAALTRQKEERGELRWASEQLRRESRQPEFWPAQLAWGGIFLDGQEVFFDQLLDYPSRIEYYQPKYSILSGEPFFPSFDLDRIVYEDQHLLVYAKPKGLPCVSSREQRKYNLRKYLDEYVGRPVHMPSRLDMSTQGLVPVSKTKLAHNQLQQVYQQRRVNKIYRLFTDRSYSWKSRRVETLITKHPDHPVLRRCSRLEGQNAVTQFKTVRRGELGALLEARPITGRTHQIRVHAQFLDIPICGDSFYHGSVEVDGQDPELHLICFRLQFPHPVTKLPLNLKVPERLLPAWAQAFT